MPGRTGGLVLAFLLLVPRAAEATTQEQAPITRRDSFWLGLGGGVGSEDVAASLNASYQFGANVVSLRTAVTAGFFDDGVTDYALLYGRATRAASEHHLLGFALGVAVVDGCYGGGLGGCRYASSVIGLPLEFQASWVPAS